MNIILKDVLVKNKYYCLTNNNNENNYENLYFKFDHINGIVVYVYDCLIGVVGDRIRITSPTITVPWVLSFKKIYEVQIFDIIFYLPEKHPDKLSYYRKQKIDYLLKI